MARIKKEYENYPVLLGGDDLNAASGSLFEAVSKLKVNDQQRTVFVGLGGAGINTINYIKGVISERLEPNWPEYIAFLAVDSDYTMLNNLKYIVDVNEKVCTTRDNVGMRMKDATQHAEAVRHAMYPPLVDAGLDWSGPGSGQRRLMGRAKLHDCAPGQTGVDKDIVDNIRYLSGKFAKPGDNTQYSVYVIGSICGGTCSGAIQDMPSLIRKALPQAKIYSMMYLPDTMASDLPDQNASKAKANGYAALKEINYYQAMSLRNSTETFYWNNAADPEIKLNGAETPFFDDPMLVGSSLGVQKGAAKLAEQTVSEYLINILTKTQPQEGAGLSNGMTIESALHNKNGEKQRFLAGSNNKKEAVGEAHDMPYQFSTIGFARAAAPMKVVKAYAVGKMCEAAGFKAIDVARTGAGFKAFSSQPFTASQGTGFAEELVKPFAELLNFVFSASFNCQKDLNHGEKIEWNEIHNGGYSAFQNKAAAYVNNHANMTTFQNDLFNGLDEMFVRYREGVKTFVKNHGPLAFANVYYGNFVKEGENAGTGIRRMLSNLSSGVNMDGSPFVFDTVTAKNKDFLARDNAIKRKADGLLHKAASAINGEKVKEANAWAKAFTEWVNADINDRRRQVSIGQGQYVDTAVCKKAEQLAEQLEVFGHLLNSLSDIYAGHSIKLADFEHFSQAQDSQCEINMAALDPSIYKWLKSQVDAGLAGLNMGALRDDLIEDFMRDPESWLDDAGAVRDGGKTLISASKPISARTKFDEFISERIRPIGINVSIKDIFDQLKATGSMGTIEAADKTIEKLRNQSKVLFNGETATGTSKEIFVIPETLSKGRPEIAEALKTSAGNNVTVFESADADGLMLYKCVCELPVNKLTDLSDWEKEYLARVATYEEGLHGLSPAAVKETVNGVNIYSDKNTMTWRDFPAITVSRQDPTVTNAEGKISYEGQKRLEVREVLKEAEKYGVVYAEHSNVGVEYYRVWLDKGTNWSFDPFLCAPNDEGFLPEGKALMQEVLKQNSKDMSAYSKQIALHGAGPLMSGRYESEEDAKPYIERIVRADVGMYMQIKETLSKFKGENGWALTVDAFNAEISKKKRSERFLRLILGGCLKQEGSGVWIVALPDGNEKPVFNSAMVQFLSSDIRPLAESFPGYYLYKEVVKSLGDSFDACVEEAERRINEMMNSQALQQLSDNREIGGFIKKEAEELASHGADLSDPDAELNAAITNYLNQFIKKQDIQKELCAFYAGVMKSI